MCLIFEEVFTMLVNNKSKLFCNETRTWEYFTYSDCTGFIFSNKTRLPGSAVVFWSFHK